MTAQATETVMMCTKFMAKAFTGPGVLGGMRGKQALSLPECFYKSYPCLYAPGYFKKTVCQEGIFDCSGQWIEKKR